MKWILSTGFLIASCAGAATTGRVIVDQTADADRGRAAVRTEMALTQAFAFPRGWISGETRYQVLVVPGDRVQAKELLVVLRGLA